MSKCPNCSPHGGAIFRMGFGWRGEAQDNYAMTCQNCGYQRKTRGPTAASKRNTTEYLFDEATSDEGLSVRNRYYYHRFNPNGAMKKLRVAQDAISAWVDRHPDQPNGVLLVHGSLNTWPDRLFDQAAKALKSRNKTTWYVNYAISHAEKSAAEAYAWLAAKAAEGLE